MVCTNLFRPFYFAFFVSPVAAESLQFYRYVLTILFSPLVAVPYERIVVMGSVEKRAASRNEKVAIRIEYMRKGGSRSGQQANELLSPPRCCF